MVRMIKYSVVRDGEGALEIVESEEVEEGTDVVLEFEADADADVEDGAWWL